MLVDLFVGDSGWGTWSWTLQLVMGDVEFNAEVC